MMYENSILKSDNWEFLKKLKDKNKIPNAILFHGNKGIGKESIAIEFAAYINCETDDVDSSCGSCSSCSKMKSNNHEYINYIFPLPKGKITSKKDPISKSFTDKTLTEYNHELKEKLINPFHTISISGANTILINSIREIKKKLYQTTESNIQKIIIIFEAEKLCYPNQEAANSLLKILEEPPNNSTFILVTSKINLLLDTIKSRCIELYFPTPSIEQFNNYNQNLESSNINLYQLLEGNIKTISELKSTHIDEIEDFIKNYHMGIKDENANIDLKLISYMSKLSKTDIFLYQIFIQALKYYYKDILNLKFGVNNYNPTFKFLNNLDMKLIKGKKGNYIDIIERFEKDMLVKMNMELSLFNLFHDLKATV